MAEENFKNKICPLTGRACLGEHCALYVRVIKPKIIKQGLNEFVDPTGVYVFEGCGLIQQVPWRLQKIPIARGNR